MKDIQKPFLLNVLIGFPLAGLVLLIEWGYGHPLLHMFCDGFYVAGVMLLGIGGIMAARNAGCFDMMGYSLKSFFGVVIPGARLGDSHDGESFLDYKERKSEKRNSATPMLLAGAVHMSIALLLTAIYTL